MSEERHDEHINVRSVTALDNCCPVVTSQAIFTCKGVKLVDKGVRINSALHGAWCSTSCAQTFNQCLEVEARRHLVLLSPGHRLSEVAHHHLSKYP